MEADPKDIVHLASQYVNTTDQSIFLTGKAGTGKTTFLRKVVESTFKKCVVAAPTGIAAINAGGVTLHSLFQLPFGGFIPEDTPMNFDRWNQNRLNTPQTLLAGLKLNANKKRLIREMELLIIDEVSMLRSDLLDAIDTTLKSVRRRKDLPFGGVQVLFIGDLNQLPPVVKDEEWKSLSQFYDTAHFFNARVIRNQKPLYIELEKIYRQSDQEFIEILNNLRNNSLTNDNILTLNRHFQEYYELDNTIFITTHNYKADRINQAKLMEIEAEPHTFKAIIEDEFPENQFPTSMELTLKTNAQVMFIKNDPSGEKRYFNGKIGVVKDFLDDEIIVECEDETINVGTFEWENVRYRMNAINDEVELDKVGSFKQYPLKLAWAVTVHKSQGLTFENAVLDVSDAFAPGQIYVALSRLTSLEGLTLTRPLPDEIIENEDSIRKFSESKSSSEELSQNIRNSQCGYVISLLRKSFGFSDLMFDVSDFVKSFKSEGKSSQKKAYVKWAQELLKEISDLYQVSLKFERQLDQMRQKPELSVLVERSKSALNYFKPKVEIQIRVVKEHLKEILLKKKVKGYTNEVKEIKSILIKKIIGLERTDQIIQEIQKGKVPTKNSLRIAALPIESAEEEEKKSSKEISLELYKSKNSMAEIAEARNMAEGTIESHLASYVASGELAIEEFVDAEKVKNIITVIDTIKSTKFGDIRSKLGDEYTWGDIRFTVSHHQLLSNKK